MRTIFAALKRRKHQKESIYDVSYMYKEIEERRDSIWKHSQESFWRNVIPDARWQ